MPIYSVSVIFRMQRDLKISKKDVDKQILKFGGTHISASFNGIEGSFYNEINYDGSVDELDGVMGFNELVINFANEHRAEVSCVVACSGVGKYYVLDLRYINNLKCTLIISNIQENIKTINALCDLDKTHSAQYIKIGDKCRFDIVAINNPGQKLETIPFYQEILKLKIEFECNIVYGAQILRLGNKN